MKKELRHKYENLAAERGLSLISYCKRNHICTSCGEVFEPEQKSKILHTNYSTCNTCRALRREQNFKKRYNGEYKSPEERFKGVCTRCGTPTDGYKTITVGPFFDRHSYTKFTGHCECCDGEITRRKRDYTSKYIMYGGGTLRRGYSSTSEYSANMTREYNRRRKELGYCLGNGCHNKLSYEDIAEGHVTCSSCREGMREYSKNSYIPSYSKETIESFKIGDKFPRDRTFEVLKRNSGIKDIEQGVIASIKNDDKDPNKICIILNSGNYYEMQKQNRSYWRSCNRNNNGYHFQFKIVKQKSK